MTSSTLWWCCWGMRSAAKQPWKRSMSACSLWPPHSLPGVDGSACRTARRSRAFSRHSTRPRSKLCTHSFCKICWLALWNVRRKPVGSGIERGPTTLSSMWMGHDKRPVNEHYLRRLIVPLHTVDCERSVRPAIPGAHEERSCEPGRRSCKHLPISGWGRFLGQATGTIVENFCRQSRWRVASAQTQSMPLRQVVVRLHGHYGNGAIVADLAGLSYVMRGKDYHLLALPQVQARLKESPDARTTHPETRTQRALFDVPDLVVTATGERSRVIVATHPVSSTAAPVGVTREEVVYELFFTASPPVAFTSADVVDLYLGRGAFETVLSDEDQEQDPDRWCSHSACGQEVWQILSQWVWNEAP